MTDQAPAQAVAQPVADAKSIDSIIDNAVIETPVKEEAPEAEATEPSEPVAEAKEEAFPKKAVNALSRRDKQIGRLRAELAAERAAKQALEQQYKPTQKAAQEPNADSEPKEGDYQTYGEYLKALVSHQTKNLISETKKKESEEKTQSDEREWEAERAEAIDENYTLAKKAFSDFNDVIEEHADANGILPLAPHVRKALLEADNGAYALYLLAKEGKLEAVNSMSPSKAAMEIARMEDRALAMSKTKPVTKAPTPLPAARGSVPSGKSLDQMSGAELLKWSKAKD